MSDDMFYVRVCQERDQLAAELAAAKAKMQEGEDDCRFCRDLEGGSKYPCTCGWTYGALALAYANAIQERDRFAADNARLLAALGSAANRIESIMETEPHLHLTDDLARYRFVLAATPTQSLAAHDAALLREVADGVDKIAVVPTIDTPQSMRDLIADAIRAKADRIEKEAQRG